MRDPFADLHDATLRGVRVDWTAGSCELDSAGAPTIGAPFSLRFRDVRRVELPRQQPWGPSACVLEVAIERSVVRITMQSGDIIAIDARGGWEHRPGRTP